ncbi:amylo-alpha-1,6-glucosidase [Lichenibacterium ramalinae]|uniref:Glycogen debranching protein n=1 Tax=Lichenibacterium ramalinae TaxID=2316527 RepID=A0A4Q2RET9_9HYPH|nr:amylo-alpha-1,6-glucosidase [Lichenibacterium ramalinae]RYB04729.1 glycogen debranching protein [Lichenibacterium ramalinae]
MAFDGSAPDGPQAQDAPEWLEADGLGGYASGAADGVRTRRYHALLLTATTPPTHRFVLVNGVEAVVETGDGRHGLSSQRYLPDVLHPDGARRILSFHRDPWPTWVFGLPDGTEVRHEVFVEPHGGETVLTWRRTAGPPGPCRLEVRPLLTGRDHGALHQANDVFRFDAEATGGTVSWRPYAALPAATALTTGTYRHDPVWRRRVLYTVERERGLDHVEDVASPGAFAFDLAAAPAVMVLRAGDGRSGDAARHAADLAATERARRGAFGSGLRGAAAAYVVARGPGRTVVAGFPWFTDWGRDTFIAMRGLLLATGRLEEARAVLLGWAEAVDGGMLPNRFPDSGEAPEFNAVDASLWFVVAVHDTLDACAAAGAPVPEAEAERWRAAAEAILGSYSAGTRFGIRAEADGLLHAGQEGVQLTWMDAITDGHVVTPRRGKPVEIQALWINALEIAARRWSDGWREPADRARAAFAARFAAPAGGLYDIVDVDGAPGAVDASVRPNQVFAVGGLPFPLLEGAAARAVVDLVEAKLLTPLGLRTLSPDDPAFIPRYRGDLVRRDAAYHQGTAWPWLLGPFVQAWLRVRGGTAAAKAEAAGRFLAPLMRHLDDNGLGHVSEVVDGAAPHHAGGCPWQAWSLGELIRIRRMLDLDV